MTVMTFETLLLERRGRVALVTLNRPDALNALNARTLEELTDAFNALEADPEIGYLVLTGSEKAFAAGADIREMAQKSAAQMVVEDYFVGWGRVPAFRKPVIAAVAGYALGGGCELAMMCDFIIAAENARFGQPEIKLGVIPAMGGSQRLTRAVGNAKAMDLCLTGRMMDAVEAERCGLVARIVPLERLLEEALSAAQTIAAYSLPSVQTAKEVVNRAFETTLTEGALYERRVFHTLFATEDQKEGMAAFLEKRPAKFQHR